MKSPLGHVHPIPHNVGEAVIEPFWAGGFSGIAQWIVTPAEGTGARVNVRWAAISFEWMRLPVAGPVFTMQREMTVDCSGYDRLTISCVLPEGTRFRITAETDAGPRTGDTVIGDGNPHEHALDLAGATAITALTLECLATIEKPLQGLLFWIGLENGTLLAAHRRRWREQGQLDWSRYFSRPAAPTFRPKYGIFLDPAGLAGLRAKHEAHRAAHGSSPFIKTREELFAADADPTRELDEFTSATGSILIRERDRGRHGRLVGKAYRAAIAGIILQDAELLEYAIKCAVCVAICEKWTESFMTTLPGCEFETRSFFQGQAMADIAWVLDLAGEFLTWHGREYLQRRMAEYGLGNINYVVWRHDYIHRCNQMPAFSCPRLYAYLVLEREWPRVYPYTDLALEELNRSLANIIHPDGSFAEGPHYIQYALQTALPAYYHYARARQKPFADILPPCIRNTARYVEAFISTDESQEFIPHNDGGTDNRIVMEDAVIFLATMLPDSHWMTAYRKHRNRLREKSPLIYIWELEDALPTALPACKAFMHLETCGIMTSYRTLGAEPVKIMLFGAEKTHAGHQHEDIASFVLEFAGDTFAMDSGTCRYDNIHATLFQHHDRHNVLVPVGLAERPHMAYERRYSAEGTGDATSFRATYDADGCWKGVMPRWQRTFESPEPSTFMVRDEYALAAGTGVEWYWLTVRDVAVAPDEITLTGRRGRVRIAVPDGCTVRVDTLSMPDERIQKRIAFCKSGTSGVIEVCCRLETL